MTHRIPLILLERNKYDNDNVLLYKKTGLEMLLLQKKTLYQQRDLGGRNIMILFDKIKLEIFISQFIYFHVSFSGNIEKLEKRVAGGFKN